MIIIKVETGFVGRTIAVRDKFVNDALANKQSLQITHNGNTMTIPYNEIKERITGKSKKSVPDYYGDKPNYLIYFRWKPNQVAHQRKMI